MISSGEEICGFRMMEFQSSNVIICYNQAFNCIANVTNINLFPLIIFQGDYIKHPVLYELSHKYGFTDNLPESALPDRLEEIKEAIRREIRKELKVREEHRRGN